MCCQAGKKNSQDCFNEGSECPLKPQPGFVACCILPLSNLASILLPSLVPPPTLLTPTHSVASPHCPCDLKLQFQEPEQDCPLLPLELSPLRCDCSCCLQQGGTTSGFCLLIILSLPLPISCAPHKFFFPKNSVYSFSFYLKEGRREGVKEQARK